jgi:hypothetical protein
LHQSKEDHGIWHADGHSNDEQVLIILFFVKNVKYERGERLTGKIHILEDPTGGNESSFRRDMLGKKI